MLTLSFPQVALGRQDCLSKQAFWFNVYRQCCTTAFSGIPPVMISLKDALPEKAPPEPGHWEI